MYEELRRKKVKLEEELKIIIQQKWRLEKELASACKDFEDKQKEIDAILDEMEEAILLAKQQKAEKAKTDWEKNVKKENDLFDVLCSKPFYTSIRKYMPEPHWKRLKKAIESNEFFEFVLKNHYANRVIKAYKSDSELNQAIMEKIVSKLRSLINKA